MAPTPKPNPDADAEKKDADPLDAMAPDHDPNTTARVRTTEMQTVGEGDDERVLAPGTAVRVPAEEAIAKVESDPQSVAPYGQTAEVAEKVREAQRKAAREATKAAYGGTATTTEDDEAGERSSSRSRTREARA